MLTREDALNLVELALRHSTADQTEVRLSADQHGLTRLANGGIHQNVAISNTEARVRAVVGQRSGVATSNRADAAGLRELVDRALAIARVSAANPDFATLPDPALITPTPAATADPAALTPERRAQHAGVIISTGTGNGVTAAGHVATGFSALAVGNSRGVRAFHNWVDGSVMVIMTAGDASGYAAWDGRVLDDAPSAEVAGQAAALCRASGDPVSLEPGRYTVILEPYAVAEMLAMLAFIGLGATALQEGRSFMCDRVGEKLVGDNISLRDDAYHPAMIGLPFDDEGVPRQVVPFFDRGTAMGVVYDTATAHKEKTRSTGHALPAPNPQGPLPLNLVLDHGAASRARMLAGIERGVLVTRFHYVNIVHPKETILTGMTRDGTFLIEHGAVTRPVKNLRFTQSVLDTLRRVSAIENVSRLVNMEGIYCLTPALRVEEFAFTS